MAKYFESETQWSTKSVPKSLTFKRKLNEWIAKIIFILVILPVYTKSDIEHVVRPKSEDEFLIFEIIKPTLQQSQNSRVIFDTRLENGSHADELILRYIHGGKDVIHVPHNHFIRYQLPNGSDSVQHFTETNLDLCHYKGAIRNNTPSYVVISTCYGIKGMIFDGNETYYIDTSLNGNVSDAHYLFRKQNQPNNLTFGYENEGTEPSIYVNEDLAIRHKYKRSTDEKIEGQSSVVELVIVVDHSIYQDFERYIKKIHHYCKDIANAVNALYVPLNISIVLVGVSIWNENDRIQLSSDSEATLAHFLQHRREVLMHEQPNDFAILLTNQIFKGIVNNNRIFPVIARSEPNSMCTFNNSGGVMSLSNYRIGLSNSTLSNYSLSNYSLSTSIIASTVANELGHTLGMEHASEGCGCGERPCIMAKLNKMIEAHSWCSCSKNALKLAFNRGSLQCLRKKPAENSTLCGNGFVEPGEECDCGLVEFCKNSCCDANTCMFHPNASCASGECCDLVTCRLHNIGTLCRPSVGYCDIPEHCTGESEQCPDNDFRRDTEFCDAGKAYCYEGTCQSHTDQCKLLWGENGKSIEQCYENNQFGNVSGNCGKNWTENSLKKCSADDMMCGQVQCEPTFNHVLEGNPRAKVNRTWSQTYPYFECQTAIFDIGQDNDDPGLTPNGAICGNGKMCYQQKCLSVKKLRVRGIGVDCPGNCSGNGICDNKGHCHCNNGYSPPMCNIDESIYKRPIVRFMYNMYIMVFGVVPMFFY